MKSTIGRAVVLVVTAFVATIGLTACGKLQAQLSCESATVKGQPAATYTYHFKGVQLGTVSIVLRSPGGEASTDQFLDAIDFSDDATTGSISYTWDNPATGYKLVLRGGKPNVIEIKAEPLSTTCPEDD